MEISATDAILKHFFPLLNSLFKPEILPTGHFGKKILQDKIGNNYWNRVHFTVNLYSLFSVHMMMKIIFTLVLYEI